MPSPVQEGEILAEKYRVERVLGEGGMGVVVAAMHIELDQRVALKFLLPEALAHPAIIDRFAREARAAAKIRSQHVARVIDTGKMANGAPFMVMEYLQGKDLSQLLTANGPFPIETAVDYVLQAIEALAEAHNAGIVHRDLKPANLFLAEQPDRRSIIKLLDFGISKVHDPSTAPLTHTSAIMGSPNYMCPEQLVATKNVDMRADIWALGVVLYELIGGKVPFVAETMPEIIGLILQNKPLSISAHRPEIPPALEQAIMKCLSSDRESRFANVAELASALAPFSVDPQRASQSVGRISRVLGEENHAPAPSMAPPSLATDDTLPLGAERPNVAPVQTQSGVSGTVPPPARSRQLVFVGGAVLIGVVVAGAFVSSRGHGPDEARSGSGAALVEPPAISSVPALPSSVTTPTAPTQAVAVIAPAVPIPAPSQSAAGSKPKQPKPVASTAPAASTSASPAAEQKNPLQMGIK